jgi:hypothetical protein
MVGEFLRALDGFLIRLEKCYGTSSDWVGVCVGWRIYCRLFINIIIKKNNITIYIYS